MHSAQTRYPCHRLRRRLVLAAALTVGLLAVGVSSAAANPPFNNGSGFFTAVSVLDPPPNVCAQYQAYNAQLVFPGPIAARVSSGARPAWGENPDGTHLDKVGCNDAPGQQIDQFTGTLTGAGLNCTLGSGMYKRGALGTVFPELNIQFVFNSVSGTCTGITAPVTLKTTIVHVADPTDPGGYISLCNSPIAPQSCVLGPASF